MTFKNMPPLPMVRHNALMGAPVDYSRPQISNPDGSTSTEETITIPRNGRWYNVPTIVNGQRVPQHIAEELFQAGHIPHVGEFDSMNGAVSSAQYRTEALAMLRPTGQAPRNAFADHGLPMKDPGKQR